MLNIHTVGAGGGSIARFDSGGALRVGPESAGADPGPICYGKGRLPTVTDANLILGRLREEAFLGGAFQLQRKRAERLCEAWLQRQGSKWPVQKLAEGIVRVVNANMEKAIRVVSVEKGHDPRDFSLVAFGGAGALHACELAAALEIPRVIVPYMPGALSAIGILVSDVVKDYSRTIMLPVEGEWPGAMVSPMFKQLREQASRAFVQEGWEGKLHFRESADLRYRGQGFELSVPLAGDPVSAFHREHQHRFGYADEKRPVEIVTLRLRAWQPSAQVLARPMTPANPPGGEKAAVIFGGKAWPAAVASRESLGNNALRGPAVITEYSATTVLPPDWTARRDPAGNLILRRKR